MGKKHKKAKLPKEVLGVKLPKEVREVGGALLEKANSPQGREMLAAGLTMAAAAATAALAKGRAERAAKPNAPRPPEAPVPPVPPVSPVPPVPPQGTQTQPDPQAIADAVGKAAEAMLGRLFGRKD
jgi:outer membrane biosynthesis protein TonB